MTEWVVRDARRGEPLRGAPRGPGEDGQSGDAADGDEGLAGTLVHRLLQGPAEGDEETLRARAAALLPADAAGEAHDLDQIVSRAVAAWRALRQDPEVAALLAEPCLFEVPFSLALEAPGEHPGVLRGSIDCVSVGTGRVTVLEVKTGRPRPWHQRQVEVYEEAARALFEGKDVVARLVYVDHCNHRSTPSV